MVSNEYINDLYFYTCDKYQVKIAINYYTDHVESADFECQITKKTANIDCRCIILT